MDAAAQLSDSVRINVYKCPSCAGVLSYDPQSGDYVCASCGSHVSLGSPGVADDSGLHGYVCSECGAELVMQEAHTTITCPYCGNNEVVPSLYDGPFKPDYVIPFKLDRSRALECYEDHMKARSYLPDDFAGESRIVSEEGVYVPYWLFTGRSTFDFTFSTATGAGEDREDALHRRCGTLDFKQVPADASIRMPNDMMDSVWPFDLNALVPFSTQHMPGFIAERYTEESGVSWPRARAAVEHTATEKSKPPSTDKVVYSGIDTELSEDGGIEQALLPVWLFVVEYRGARYLMGVNGQTGGVAMNYPIDMRKRMSKSIANMAVGIVVALLFFAIPCVAFFGSILDERFMPLLLIFAVAFLVAGALVGLHVASESISQNMENVHEAKGADDHVPTGGYKVTLGYSRSDPFNLNRRLT